MAERGEQPEASKSTQNGERSSDRPDPLQYYEDRMKFIEASLENAEKSQQEQLDMITKVEDNCKSEIHTRLSALEEEFRTVVDSTLGGMGECYEDITRSRIETKQTHVLRTNKIIRDVSRALGPDWRQVFQHVMSSFGKDVVDVEMEKLERQRPFIQAYKALSRWKEMSEENLDMMELVSALKLTNNYELAEKVLDTMDSEGETLLALENVGKGVRRGSDVPALSSSSLTGRQASGDGEGDDGASSATSVANGGDGGAASEATGATVTQTGKPTVHRRQPATSGDVNDPLGNATLLKISRKMGEVWQDVGRRLEMSDEDLHEIRKAEAGYQAAFKMLWAWRDGLESPGSDEALSLAQALEECGLDTEASMIRSAVVSDV